MGSGSRLRMLDDPRRYSNCGCLIGDVHQYQGEGADLAVIADPDASQNLGIGAKLDVIANPRNGAVDVAIAYRHALAQRAVAADDHVGMDDDGAKVPDSQPRADVCRDRQRDAGGSLDQSI